MDEVRTIISAITNSASGNDDDNMVFYKRQFGFQKNNSTSHAIITLVEKSFKALDTGKYVVGVFFDIKKAFGTVDHNILLPKLKHMA